MCSLTLYKILMSVLCMTLSFVISNLKPVAKSPFKNKEGASSNEPMPRVNCLNVNNPKSASSINHLIKIVIYFAIGILSISGNSVIQTAGDVQYHRPAGSGGSSIAWFRL